MYGGGKDREPRWYDILAYLVLLAAWIFIIIRYG